MTPASSKRRTPIDAINRSTSTRTVLVALIAVAVSVAATACTPEQFQQWWTSHGNEPLGEPELSRAAAAATAHWDEVAREQRFSWSASPISDEIASRMTPTSWRPGCPVQLSSLRYLRLSFMGFDGAEHLGELVVHERDVTAVAIAFKLMWDDGFRIERMQLVDDFGGDDAASMAANNTSAFNCRRVSGGSQWSEHAYGRAIDINPVQNPWVSGSQVEPATGAAFSNRHDVRTGMLVEGGPAVAAFDRIAWGWGGRWSSVRDYQHVSASGR
ncbi:MAG: M15 family metallopeptidase [Microthrixaceae bacterium]